MKIRLIESTDSEYSQSRKLFEVEAVLTLIDSGLFLVDEGQNSSPPIQISNQNITYAILKHIDLVGGLLAGGRSCLNHKAIAIGFYQETQASKFVVQAIYIDARVGSGMQKIDISEESINAAFPNYLSIFLPKTNVMTGDWILDS